MSERDPASELRHELRTPLNHILGYAEMLIEDGESLPQRAAQGLQSVRASAQSILDLLHTALPPGETHPDLNPLRMGVRAPLDDMRRNLDEIGSEAELSAEARGDLGKIGAALDRLERVTQEGPPPAKAEEAPATEMSRAEPGQGQGRLLIVDDDPANRDVLSRQLQRQGYSVAMAGTGAQALELLQQECFDLVLLDMIMPGISGFQVLQSMKCSPGLYSIPVIMISALDETKSVVKCIETGAEDYLPKPFDPILLKARIGASLEKKRLRDKEQKRAEELEKTLAELRKTQDQLIVQEKLASLGSLTAGIAHEIKNPLNFVTNFASLSLDLLGELRQELSGKVSTDAEALIGDLEQNVAKIEEHGKRADRIVRGMLMHARGRTGERELVDLNQLLTDCLNLAYHGLRAQDSSLQIRMETDLDPQVGQISAIPQDLSRVFLNIVNNACQSAGEKKKQADACYVPTVSARTRVLGSRVEIRIRDNGLGIPEDVRRRIFEPFFTTKPAGVGTGLGLSLSYEIIVREHKGQLLVDSEPGEYAEFIITLPRKAETEAAVHGAQDTDG